MTMDLLDYDYCVAIFVAIVAISTFDPCLQMFLHVLPFTLTSQQQIQQQFFATCFKLVNRFQRQLLDQHF